MQKFVRIFSKLTAAVLVAYLLIIILAVAFIKPDQYKSIISKSFYTQTHSQLSLKGDIKLSLFPYPGITLNKVVISNPRNFQGWFENHQLATIEHLKVHVKILKLITGKIVPSRVLIQGANLTLLSRPSGETNWAKLIPSNTNKHNQPSSAGIKDFPTIQIEDANATLIDESTLGHTTLSDLNLIMKPRSSNGFSFDLNSRFTQTHPKLQGKFYLSSEITALQQHAAYQLTKLSSRIIVDSLEKPLKTPLAIHLSGKGSSNPSATLLTLKGKILHQPGTILMTLKRQSTTTHCKAVFNGLPIETLLLPITQTEKLTGSLNMNAHLSWPNHHSNWFTAVSGKGQLSLNKGKLIGHSIDGMIMNALSQKLSVDPELLNSFKHQETPTTPYHEISSNFTINNGKLLMKTFTVKSKHFNATAKNATIDLRHNTIDMLLMGNNPKLSIIKVPLAITGSLLNPRFKADFSASSILGIKPSLAHKVESTVKTLESIFHF